MKTDKDAIAEINREYGSVSKMIAKVNNKIHSLVEYGGYKGRDGADTLDQALREIPNKYHRIFFKYHHTYPRP
jgi:hypothetical protein